MIVGWKEYILLPDIQTGGIRAKLDTGALTSSLDARDIKTFWDAGEAFVEFRLAPARSSSLESDLCRAPILDRRIVRNSGGQEESRIIILSTLVLAEQTIQTERPNEFSGINWSTQSGSTECFGQFRRPLFIA